MKSGKGSPGEKGKGHKGSGRKGQEESCRGQEQKEEE